MWPQSASVRQFYLAHLSRPAYDRPIYQLIRRHGLRRIVELGVGLAERSARMIEVAAMAHRADDVVFTGVDLFELRAPQDSAGLSLKLVHRRLAATGAKIRLLPGDPYMALARAVNMLGAADLVVISADQDRTALEGSWFYVERLLHDRSHVLVQELGCQGARRRLPVGAVGGNPPAGGYDRASSRCLIGCRTFLLMFGPGEPRGTLPVSESRLAETLIESLAVPPVGVASTRLSEIFTLLRQLSGYC